MQEFKSTFIATYVWIFQEKDHLSIVVLGCVSQKEKQMICFPYIKRRSYRMGSEEKQSISERKKKEEIAKMSDV